MFRDDEITFRTFPIIILDTMDEKKKEISVFLLKMVIWRNSNFNFRDEISR